MVCLAGFDAVVGAVAVLSAPLRRPDATHAVIGVCGGQPKVFEARKIGISQSFSVWHQASYSALVVNDVSMNGGGTPSSLSMNGGGTPSSLSMNGGGAPSSLSAAAFSPLSAAAFFGAAFFLLSAAF